MLEHSKQDVGEQAGESLLVASDVAYVKRGKMILTDVSLQLGKGEIITLIGPNGAGKTTVFNVLSGYVQPTQGSVKLHGEDLAGMPQTGRVKAGISRTFQSPKLVLDSTVMENVLVGRHHLFKHGHLAELLLLPSQRREETEARAICMEMLERFGLADDAHRETGDLSLGSQKIVEVCRALVAEPSVILLDEPAAGLGPEDVTVLLAGLRELVADRQLCLVIIEHDLELVTALCPEISVLHFGRIIARGTPAEVTSDPVVIEAYLGAGFELSEDAAGGGGA